MIFVPNTLKPTKHNSGYKDVFCAFGEKWQVMGHVVILREVFRTN